MATTYDGLPISATPPFGATIVVSCLMNGDRRYLLLHRAHAGPAYEGDWAWTPPAGSRLPDEPIEICAVRELAEETGLSGVLRAIYNSDTDWALFALDLDAQPEVTWMGNTTATNGQPWPTPGSGAGRKPSLRVSTALPPAINSCRSAASYWATKMCR